MEAVSGIHSFLEYVIQGITNHPERTHVALREQHGTTIFDLSADGEDIPRLIGSAGSTVNALRALAQATAAQHGLRVNVEISD